MGVDGGAKGIGVEGGANQVGVWRREKVAEGGGNGRNAARE